MFINTIKIDGLSNDRQAGRQTAILLLFMHLIVCISEVDNFLSLMDDITTISYQRNVGKTQTTLLWRSVPHFGGDWFSVCLPACRSVCLCVRACMRVSFCLSV